MPFIKGKSGNPDGKPKGTLSHITRRIREVLATNDVEFIENLFHVSEKELDTRTKALEVFDAHLTMHAQQIIKLKGVEGVEAHIELLKEMTTELKLTLPGLESTKLYAMFLKKCVPDAKPEEVPDAGDGEIPIHRLNRSQKLNALLGDSPDDVSWRDTISDAEFKMIEGGIRQNGKAK